MTSYTRVGRPVCAACSDPLGRVDIEVYHDNHVDARCNFCGHQIAVHCDRPDLLEAWRKANRRMPVAVGTSTGETVGSDQ